MPRRNTIQIEITADDKASSIIQGVADNVGNIGEAALKTVAVGAAAATAAVVGFGAAGVKAFSDFEGGMNEVFTLLPGISKSAMDQMSAEVKGFSEYFGTLPNEVIPALYQSISAGVPQDNVFNFLEIAQKAALGGVTELETAVDGISSVVNAYGDDVLSAANASDLMFTAVKLGKTDFEQLSNSLYNVIPTAAGLGIEFGNVTAALAAMTAQGTPTSVATTQLRQLFVELSKPASAVAKTFEEISGKSFKDFIAEGNNVQDALILLEDYATQTGIGVNDLFGSVEAGNAALALTGKGTQVFSDNLKAMGESAGATDAAFEQMDQGIGRSLAKLTASWQVLLTNIGALAAPLIAPIIDAFTNFIRIISNALESGETMSDWLTHLPVEFQPVGKVIGEIVAIIRKLVMGFGDFFRAIREGTTPWMAFINLISNAFPTSIAESIINIVRPLRELWVAAQQILQPIKDWIVNNIELQDILGALSIAIGAAIIPAILKLGGALFPITSTFGLLVAAVRLFRLAWDNNFLGIRDTIEQEILPRLELLANWFINDALPNIISFIQTTVAPAFDAFIAGIADIWERVRPGLENFAKWFIEDAIPAVVDFITGTVIPGIEQLISTLIRVWNDVSPFLGQLATWFLEDALPEIKRFIEEVVIPLLDSFINGLIAIWTTVEPYLSLFYNWFVEEAMPEIVRFLNEEFIPTLTEVIDQIAGWIEENPELVKQLGLIAAAITIGIPLVSAIGTAISVVSGFVTLLSGGFTALVAVVTSAVGPILAIGAAIAGVILQIREFNRLTNEGAQNAQQAVQSSGISDQALYDQAFKSTADQFGGGFFGDLAARLLAGNVAQGAKTGEFHLVDTRRAEGGIITKPEIAALGEDLPRSGGFEAVLNAHQIRALIEEIVGRSGGNGGGIVIQQVTVVANSYSEGNEAGRGFIDGLREAGVSVPAG